MGKLTKALEATKELRKQFREPPKPKKLTKRNQDIQDAIYNTDFGCKASAVAKLISKVIDVDIVKVEDKHPNIFTQVPGALLVYTKEDSESRSTGMMKVDEDVGSEYIRWDVAGFGRCSMGRHKNWWRPATDKEIREFFS